MSVNSIVFNRACKKADRKRDAGLEIPEDVYYIKNLRYGGHRKYHTLDICWPVDYSSEEEKKFPVIVSVHGGGYVYGSKEVYRFYAARLAKKGFIVVNFNYRLAPKYRFPAPLEDLQLVMRWIMMHETDYPFDLRNVFLVGDSAGAQIASQYGVIYANRDYRKIMGLRKPKLTIRGLGLCCGMYDLRKTFEKNMGRGIIRDYLTGNPAQFGEMLDVLAYVNADYPPAYIFTSGGDFLRYDAEPMAKLLERRGAKAEYKTYGTDETGHVFHVDMRNEFADEANTDMTEFFKKIIQPCFFGKS